MLGFKIFFFFQKSNIIFKLEENCDLILCRPLEPYFLCISLKKHEFLGCYMCCKPKAFVLYKTHRHTFTLETNEEVNKHSRWVFKISPKVVRMIKCWIDLDLDKIATRPYFMKLQFKCCEMYWKTKVHRESLLLLWKIERMIL